MRKATISFVFIFLIAFSDNASAALISFTQTGAGSGSIGATSFTDKDFTITATGDTTKRGTLDGGVGYFIYSDLASISITDVGTFDFVATTRFFVNNNVSIVGFSQNLEAWGDLYFDLSDTAFSAWDMRSSIGPITGSGYRYFDFYNVKVQTSDGTLSFLTFTNSAGPVTFEATVPEPGTLLLLGSGLLGLVVAGRKKFRK